jgi:hypothetical protein
MAQMQASSTPDYAYNPYATYAQLPYAAQLDNPYAAAYGYDPYAAVYGVDPYTATAAAYPTDLYSPSQDQNAAVADAADPYALAAAYGYYPYALAAAYAADPYMLAAAYGYDPYALAAAYGYDPYALAAAYAADPYMLAAAYGYDPYALAAAYGSEFNMPAYPADPSMSLTNYDPYAASVLTDGSDPYATASRSSVRIGPDHASDPSATVTHQYSAPTAMAGESLASGTPDSGLITLTVLKSSSEDTI